MANKQLKLEDRLAMSVGWVAIESAEVEFAASGLEVTLLGTRRAFDVVAGQGWSQTRQAIGALIRQRLSETDDDAAITVLDAVRDTMHHADELMTKRSNVVHALWLGLENGNPREPVTPKRWGKAYRGPWTGAEVEQLRHDLRLVRDQIVAHDESLGATDSA